MCDIFNGEALLDQEIGSEEHSEIYQLQEIYGRGTKLKRLCDAKCKLFISYDMPQNNLYTKMACQDNSCSR